jgi:cell shape-determining protein MreC
MTYIQSNNNRQSRNIKNTIFVIVVLIAVTSLTRLIFPSAFSGLSTAIARPFWRTQFSLANGQLESAEGLLAANQDLLRKLDEANTKLLSASMVIAENDQLKSMMGRASTTPHILAAVLKKPPLAPYDELVLDVGSDMDFTIGDMVYANGNIPIGKIRDVSVHSSKVLLFSSPGQTFNVLVGKMNIPATAIGRGGGQYSMELPRTTAVSEGDFVSIPSLRSNLYGIVGAVVADPSLPFETILFSAPVNIYQLKWVLVGK